MTAVIDVKPNRNMQQQPPATRDSRRQRFSDDAEEPNGSRYQQNPKNNNNFYVVPAQRQFGAPASRSPSPTRPRRGSYDKNDANNNNNNQTQRRSVSQHELSRQRQQQQQNGGVYPHQQLAPPLKGYQPFSVPANVPPADVDDAPPVQLPRKQHRGGRKHHGRRKRGGGQHRQNITVTTPVTTTTAAMVRYPLEVESRGGYEYPRTPTPPPLPPVILQTPNQPVYTTTSTHISTPLTQPPTVVVAPTPAPTYRPASYYYGPNASSYRKKSEKVLTTVGEPAPPSRHFGVNSRFIHTIKKLPLGWTKHSIVTTGTEPDTGVVTTVKQNIITNEDRHREKYLRNERQKPAGVYEEYPRYKWYCRPRPANTSAYAWTLVIAGLFNLVCGFFMIILAYNAQGDSGTILLWKILGPIGMALGLIFLLIGLYLLYYYYKYDRKNKVARLAREEEAANSTYYSKRGANQVAPSYVVSGVPYSTYAAGDGPTAAPHHHYEHLRSVPPTVINGDNGGEFYSPAQPHQPILKSALSNRSNNGVGTVDEAFYSQPLNPQTSSNVVAANNGRNALRSDNVKYREPPVAVAGYPHHHQLQAPVYAQPAARLRN